MFENERAIAMVENRVAPRRRKGICRLFYFVLVLFFVMGQSAPAEGLYVKRGTWQASMLDYQRAVLDEADGRAGPFKVISTDVIRGGVEPVRIAADVTGLDELWLEVTVGGDDYYSDQAVWAVPVLIDAAGGKTDVTTLKPISVKVGWGNLVVNKDHRGVELVIGSRGFEKGFWAHGPSVLGFKLDGKYKRFETWVGIGSAAGGAGSVRFKVSDRKPASQSVDVVWAQLKGDFADEQSTLQMMWERQDNIWRDVDASDADMLALRYVKATAKYRRGDGADVAVEKGDLDGARAYYYQQRLIDGQIRETVAGLKVLNIESLRLAIADMTKTFEERYAKGPAYLSRLEQYGHDLGDLAERIQQGDGQALKEGQSLLALAREALLANPLLDFDKLVVLQRRFGDRARSVMSGSLGMPGGNYNTHDTIARSGWDNEIAMLSDIRGEGNLKEVYKSDGGKPITDPDLHFDGGRIMFSSIGKQGNWRIFEVNVDGTGFHQVTPDDGADVAHFDSCYLPDGRIIFDSTATFVGLPCVNGVSEMACLYLYDPAKGSVRQLAFEQDSDWCPTVLNNGRVLYLRWEYAGLPHSNSRILMHMNPDGTGQMAYYASSSYFPNSFFFARPIPNHPTKVVGIIGGHHGISRSGRMLIIDPAVGRAEADGVVQEIPYRDRKVEPIVRDRLIDGAWPQILHPYPLSENYFLVSMKRDQNALWGIYLVDVFDNMTLIKEVEGAALLDPIPFRKQLRPPEIPDRVDLKAKDAIVNLVDVYHGPGLKGIPRGSVKKLRMFAYYFSPRGVGGLLGTVGMDGPWDIKRVLGTVPVEADGSANFRVPANTPISIQPLDAEGKAMQLMRSWFVGMPGENVSCVGCHDDQNTASVVKPTIASRREPSKITPWYGPVRGFSFHREVQPVLDELCIGCHNGEARGDGTKLADLRGDKMITDWVSQISGRAGTEYGGKFSQSYAELHRYVRRPGIESDMHMLAPMDVHADSTELVQMLKKGHHNVKLNDEHWDRLITWIDLNTPYHGVRHEIPTYERAERAVRRGRELQKLYAGINVDYEAIPVMEKKTTKPIIPKPLERPSVRPVSVSTWPFDETQARLRQNLAGETRRSIDLGDGVKMELVYVPAGEFVMGDSAGHIDEQPTSLVRIDRPFWMGRFEVSNEQFARFDAAHDSRHEHRHGYQFGRLGYPLNEPKQPVVRISYREAVAFCKWFSERSGNVFTLPTEAQWEWACRAGANTAFSFGDLDADFSRHANLGDIKLKEFAACTADGNYTRARILPNPNKYDDWIPRDNRFNDKGFVSTAVGQYQSNAWGLHDMHGNVWEWTRSSYRPYPYDAGKPAADDKITVRGGSWYDRPKRCTSGHRLAYRQYQKVFNVGFRVVCGDPGRAIVKAD